MLRRPTRAVIPPAAPAKREPMFSLADISVLSGKPDTGPTPGSVEQMYMIGESLFGAVAVDMRARGWAVYPQERDERRMPSMVDKRAIKISKYFDKAPSPKETRRWSLAASGSNAAILLGASSGNTFCIDADLSNPDQSRTVQDLAKGILGETSFQRVGTDPKIALFYRTATPRDLPPNKAYVIEDGGDQIEVLSRGKSITAYGQHHKTGKYFTWFGGKPPVIYGPEHCPVVSPEQMQRFIDAVKEALPFKAKAASILSAAFDGAMDSIDGWSVPSIDGDRLADGREPWLTKLVFETVRQNPGRVATLLVDGTWEPNPAGMAAGVEVIMAFCREHMILTDRWSDGTPLRNEVSDRLRRNTALLAAGGYKFLGTGKMANGKAVATRSFVEQAAPAQDPALWHLPARDKRRALDFASATMPDAVIAASRALQPDRSEVSIRVDLEIAQALDMYFDRVYQTEQGLRAQVHVLASPAGSGKTTQTLKYIAADPRTYMFDELPPDERPGPLVFLLPTYNNISELRARAVVIGLDPALEDEDLAEAAAAKGLMSVEDALVEIKRIRATATGSKLRTMVYQGKIAAGCKLAEKVAMLSAAGLGSSGLCHARVPKKPLPGTPKGTPLEYRDEYCPHYRGCPAIEQRKQIAEQHIVFLPHAFMSLSIPEELQRIRGVIADERIFSMFVHTTEFSLDALRRPRREPKLTKAEAELGMTPDDLLGMRDEAAWIATRALESGQCPIAALAAFTDVRPKRTITGLDLAAAAVRVNGGASAATGAIFPGMSDYDLAAICEAPAGKHVREEWRFWSIIRDRIEGLADGKPLPPKNKDIQLRCFAANGVDHQNVRISWITEPNWSAAPVLLLDASADKGIVQAIFPDREVKMHVIEADMNCRVVAVVDKRYSQSSMICNASAEPAVRAACAANLESIRDRLVFLSAVHANGRIVACASRAVRRAINADWVCPGNLDWIHYGAERGLNFAERHVAAVIIGRMELPTWMYDGLACALAGDTDPLVLLDPLGTGLDDKGERLKPTLDVVPIRRRDGADLGLLTARNPAGWLRIVQQQFREEGIMQALCRVRPVYRSDAPTVYLFCQSIPEGLIVDEICSGSDLRPSYQPLLEACRMTSGIIDAVTAADQRDDIGTPKQFREMLHGLPMQLGERFSRVDWTNAEGKRVPCAVPGYISNPVAVVVAALKWADIPHAGAPVLVRQAERVEPAAPRPVDDLMTEAGSIDDRRKRERLGLEQAVERLSAESLYIPSKGKHPAGPGELAQVKLWLSSQALIHGIAEPKAEAPPARTILEDYMESEAIAL
jgi:hypothetical protein